MKALFISTHSPFETKTGAHQRTGLIFNSMCAVADVDVVCFTEDPHPGKPPAGKILYWGSPPVESRKNPMSVLWIWRQNFLFPLNKIWASIVHNILAQQRYDRIVVRYIQNALACGLNLDSRLIIDADDLPEQHYSTAAESGETSFCRRFYYRLAARLARHHTAVIARKCRQIFLANKAQCARPGFSWLPNMPISRPAGRATPGVPASQELLFVSLLSYPPNQEGMAHFLSQIWPDVRRAHPGATLRIAGNGLSAAMHARWSSVDGVSILGFVPDIVAEYSRCRAVVVPIYQGSGTNIKVLEAMQLGRPCVISHFASKGFEGLLVDGETALIARNDREFTDKLAQLLSDRDLSSRIAANADRAIRDYCRQLSIPDILARYL